MSATYRDARASSPRPGACSTSSRCSCSCSSTRSGPRASSNSTKPPACRCARTDRHGCSNDTHEIDAVTGTATTGHEWDGMQRAQHAAAALVAVAVLRDHRLVDRLLDRLSVLAAGVLLHRRRVRLAFARARSSAISRRCKAQRGPMVDKLAAASLQEIVTDPQLLDFARAQGRPAFAENCAPCHGAGGGGAKGYPNLNDDDWLWGGKLDEIAQTIRHGIRSERRQDAGRAPHAGLRPRRHAQARRHRDRRRLRALARADCRSTEGRSRRRQEGLRRHLRRLSRRRRQGQARASARRT